MFLKVQDPANTADNSYYYFPDGTTNVAISVQGGDGGNGGDGRDGSDGTATHPNGKAGGNGGNPGRGGRSGRVRFFYSESSALWLKNIVFYTNAGVCGVPGYPGMGGLGYRSSDNKIASGKSGSAGYSGKPCAETVPDGPAPFFMQFDPASVLTDEISAGLPLR
jgi:hypothetical protein